jgi:histidinol-phosphate phosphatase family protein
VADRLQESFLLVYGDIFLDLDVGALLATHPGDADSPVATLTVRASDHPWDSHLVVADELGRVSEFVSERVPGQRYRNLANAALYVCGREILKFIPQGGASDFGKDVFPACLAAGAGLKTWLLPEDDYVKDMGTPDRLAAVERYLDRKSRARAARAVPRRVRVVLLDRDGTLNVERGLIAELGQLELLPGAGTAVARLGAAGLGCHVVTNQPVIARGLCSVGELEAIHARLRELLAECGAAVGLIRYCPHHPETHHAVGVPELRRACDCRKPNAGLLWQVMDELGLDPAEVVMVGDREVDVLAGVRAGTRTILLQAGGAAPRAGDLDVVLPDLAAAVDFILSCWS